MGEYFPNRNHDDGMDVASDDEQDMTSENDENGIDEIM